MAEPTEPLLSRFPELTVLEHDPSISAALHGSDAGRLYQALRQWLSRHGSASDAETVRQVLANRRRFLMPVKSGPKLLTLNGVGARIYGASERSPQDGSYITTLYFTVLYIPIFPLGQYLVRKTDRRRFAFLGKVPLSSALRVWRRMWGVGLAAAAVTILLVVWSTSQHSTVHLINGFDVPVEVSAAGRQVEVPPRSQIEEEWPAGPVAITATTNNGRVIDRATCDIARLTNALQAYDVAGVQPLVREEVHYYASSSDVARQPTSRAILAGQRCINLGYIDDAFREPPKQVEIDADKDEETRIHVELTPGGWWPGAVKLMTTGDLGDEKIVLTNALSAMPDDQHLVSAATGLLEMRSSASDVVTTLTPIADAHPNAIAIQRAFEDALRDAGEDAQAVQRYQAAYEKHSDSPAAAYLYARLLPFVQAAPIYAKALATSPHDVWLRFAYATALTRARRFSDALPLFKSLWEDTPEKRGPMFADYATGLVAEQRVSEALALAKELEPAGPAAWLNAVTYACLVHLAGGSALSTADIAKQILDPRDVTPGTAEELQLLSGQPAELKPKGAAPDALKTLQLLSALANDPAAALSLPDPQEHLGLLGPSALLLAGEAWRAGKKKVARATLAGVLASAYAEAVASYWQDDKRPADFDDMPLDAQAAAEFEESRLVTGAERQKLVEQAKADDVLHGLVTTAIARWPSP